MTNEEFNGYRHYPVCDHHLHLLYDVPLDRSVKTFENIIRYFGYERITLQALTNSTKVDDPSDNAKAFYIKDVINAHGTGKVAVFANLFHYYDGRDTADGYLRQARLLYAIGCDGFKNLDGKPSRRKKLGRRLDDPIFDPFYSFLEEKDLPMTMHLGDPPSFWDISKISAYALKVGWYCDETFPRLEEMRAEVEGILQKHPKLRLTLAHFFFLADNLEECVRLYEAYPNLSFDLTPGGEMFKNFQNRLPEWRAFFKKYSARIYLGTDTYNNYYSEKPEDYEANVGHRLNLVRRMLETDAAFEDSSYGILQPLALDGEVLQNIYHDNYVRLVGEPRPVQAPLAAAYASGLMTSFEHGHVTTGDAERDGREMESLGILYRRFLEK